MNPENPHDINLGVINFYEYYDFYTRNRLTPKDYRVVCVRTHTIGEAAIDLAHIYFPKPFEMLEITKLTMAGIMRNGVVVKMEPLVAFKETEKVVYMGRPIFYDLTCFMPLFVFN